MAMASKVVLFGDQTVDPCPLIKQLWRQSKTSLTLQAFFRTTYTALRQELAISDIFDRSKFPSFDSISTLSEAYSQSSESNQTVFTVLLCVAQLGLVLS